MSYDFWKTGGVNPGWGPLGQPESTEGVTVQQIAADEWGVYEGGVVIARTFPTRGMAAHFCDARRVQKREQQRRRLGA